MRKSITVEELINILKELPQDAKVVKQDGLEFYNVRDVRTVYDFGERKVLIQ